MDDLATLAGELSAVFPSERTRHAALRLLDRSDPSDALDRLYRYLVWQRTLRVALGHLEEAGADLGALHIREETFRSTFPRGYRPAWVVELPPPVTARSLVDLYATHKRLLGDPVADLADGEVTGVTLVSGRAYEARYPEYRHRAEFDTDLVVADFETAAAVAALLGGRGYTLDSVSVSRLGDRPDAKVEIRAVIAGHLVSVGVLVGGYHGHRGAIAERAGDLPWRGRTVRAAGPEDLLLMLAARIRRKGLFANVNVNDAAVILDTDGEHLDWAAVEAGAHRAHLGPVVAVLVERAGRMLGRQVAPAGIVAMLAPTTTSRRWVSVGAKVADADTAYPRTTGDGLWPARLLRPQRRPDAVSLVTPVQALRKRAWRASLRRPSEVGPRLSLRAQRGLLSRQMRRARRGAPSRLDPLLARLRTRCGTMCEIDPGRSGGDGTCLARLGHPGGSPATRPELRRLAALFGAVPGPHDCGHFRFDLRSGDSPTRGRTH